jgi:hypothetical protein
MTNHHLAKYAFWGLLGVVAVAALVATVVLLRGDPTYLIQQRTRGGQPYGDPAPVSFAMRAFSVTVLLGGLGVVTLRALSDAAVGLLAPLVVGLVLWLAGAAVFAGTRPLFPAALLVPWFVLPLLLIVFAETLSDVASQRGPAPPITFWGLGLVLLALPIGWFLFYR